MDKIQLDRLMASLRRKGKKVLSDAKKLSPSIDQDRIDQYRKHIRTFVVDTKRQAQKGFHTAQEFIRSRDWKQQFSEWGIMIRNGELKRFFRENRPVVIAGASFMVVSLMGVYCFINIDKALFTAEKVDFAKESVAARQAAAQNQPTAENLKNINAVRRIGIQGYGIYADGRLAGFAETKADAQKVLDTLKKQFTPEGAKEAAFQECVEIRPVVRDIAQFDGFKTVDEEIQSIIRGTSETKEHVVQDGENLWLIAHKYHIPMDTLIAANPTINPDRVKINQKINLVVAKPMITVATKQIKEYAEAIPYEVAYEESGSLYKGESSVKRAGAQGKRTITAEVVCVNGKEVGRKVLSETISQQPVKKIVVKGTKAQPPKMGMGTFMRPTSRGLLTSSFGSRWGGRHEGIDVGMPIGTPVRSADGGTVVYAGYYSGYGLTVLVNHGGGYQTRYAHLSQLCVQKGSSVFQGQTIAKSGNTGQSTGPHLHFEVIKNGRPVNPLGYVRY